MIAISYAYVSAPFLIALFLGLLIPAIIVTAYSRLWCGLSLACVAWLGEIVNLSGPLFNIGLSIFPADLPIAMLATSTLFRWVFIKDTPKRSWAWLLLLAVFALNLVLGLATNGTAAGVQARPEFYSLVAASYMMSFRIEQAEFSALFKAMIVSGFMVIALCLYRWAVYYGNITYLLPPGGTYNIDGAIRVVPSNAALLLAQLAIVGLFFRSSTTNMTTSRWLAPFALACVLVLQHRSVWLAGIVAFLLCFSLNRAQKAPLWQQIFISLAIVVTAAAPISLNTDLSTQLRSSAQRAISGQDTVSDRFQNWNSTLQAWINDGPSAIAIGRLAGSDTRRTVQDALGQSREITYGAHNHYVSTLSSLGLLGLLSYLFVLVTNINSLKLIAKKSCAESSNAALFIILIGSQVAYYVAYGTDTMQYLVMGASIAWISCQSKPNKENMTQSYRQHRTSHNYSRAK